MKKLLCLAFLTAFLLTACFPSSPSVPPTAEPKLEPSPTPTLEPTVPPAPPAAPVPVLIDPQSMLRLYLADEIQVQQPIRIVWGSDSQTIAVITTSGVTVYDANTLLTQQTYPVTTGKTLLDFSSNSIILATTVDFQTITLTDITTGQVERTINPGHPIIGASFSPSGDLLVVGSAEEWSAEIWDSISGEFRVAVTGFETAAPIYNVVFGSTPLELAWFARATLQTQDISSGAMSPALSHEDFISTFALPDTGTLVATAAGGTVNGEFAPLVYIWDRVDGAELARLILQSPAASMDFSPGDQILAVANGDRVNLIDVNARLDVGAFNAHTGTVIDARFSPDGMTLATIGSDLKLRFWKAAAQ